MAKQKSRYDEDEQPQEPFDEKALQRAVEAFHDAHPPMPPGTKGAKQMTTADLLRTFQGLFGTICTDKQLHDALINAGYRYEHWPVGFVWMLKP
jgi:hypothetical protein